ncbi:MAG: ATP-binding protein [Usitatibacter sp.]
MNAPYRVALLFVAGYLALDWVSYIHPLQQYSITPWNPQPALAIALLMLGGQRWLPLVFAAVVGAEVLVRGQPALEPSTLLVGAVLSLAYAAIARALRGRFEVDPMLGSRRDVVRLVAVVSAGAFATGVLYIAALLASGQGPLDDPFEALARFWIGDAIGVLVTLPPLLMLSVPARRAEVLGLLRRPEAALHAAALVAALAVVFLLQGPGQVRFFYVLFLPLILAATRYGMAGATVAALIIQGAVIVSGELAGLREITVIEFQALLIALTVTGLFLGVTVDERRRAEAELRGTLRLAAAGEMAAALAHELNQPLTAVASYARAAEIIARRRDADGAMLEQTLAKLTVEATRAADVVRRLRDFFRAGSMDLRACTALELVERAAQAAAQAASARQVTIEAVVSENLPPVMADAVQMQVVLRNLLANAVDAAALEGGVREVAVSAAARGGEVVITVRDSGGGVPSADLQRIFEPFETTRATGMGMGLAIGRAIVEAHGGRLWAEAGAGGAFHLALPAAEASRG